MQIFASLTIILLAIACTEKPSEKTMTTEQRLKWFEHDKFGMFIHWGLYAIPAGEWEGTEPEHNYAEHIMRTAQIPVKEYEKLAKQFNPTKFDPDKWVQIAKDAGMKYMVITAKHHDGFAMYDSKVSEFDIVDASPYPGDLMLELSKACQKQDLRFGFYYSHARDWHEPGSSWNTYANTWDFPEGTPEDFDRYLKQKAMPQVRELLTDYGPIAVMWFDTPYKISKQQSQAFVDLVHRLQPQCLVNSRVGNELGDYRSMGDNEIPDTGIEFAWETAGTMNDSWGFKKSDNNWKTTDVIIHQLVDIVSKGGNYLLNVGPTAEGVIPPVSQKILHEVGHWMDQNSESIYGTTASPVGRLPWGRCTAKPDRLYFHVFDWPDDGQLVVPPIKGDVKHVYILSHPDHKSLDFNKQESGEIVVNVPPKPVDTIDTVITFEL
jgi:alpha-L-fucosidase